MDEKKNNKSAIAVLPIFIGVVCGIAAQFENGFVAVIIIIGVAVLVFIVMLLYLLYIKTVGKNRFYKKSVTNMQREEYDYESEIANLQKDFYADNIGVIQFDIEGINIPATIYEDFEDEYIAGKNSLIQKMLGISEDKFRILCAKSRDFGNEDLGVYENNYRAEIKIPYSSVQFKAIYFNSLDILPMNFLSLSFKYGDKTITGCVRLTKHVLHWLLHYNLEIENLDNAISNRSIFRDTKKTVFRFPTLNKMRYEVGLSSLGISVSDYGNGIAFIVLYGEIEKIAIHGNVMKVFTKHKSFFFMFQSQMYDALIKRYEGEIKLNCMETEHSFCEKQPIISVLALKTIVNRNETAYAEIFFDEQKAKFFFLTTVNTNDVSGCFWKTVDSIGEGMFFDTFEAACQTAERSLELHCNEL